jgi:hypothetical protein
LVARAQQPPLPVIAFVRDGSAAGNARYRKSQCLGGREIEDELEFARLPDWDIAGLRPARKHVDQVVAPGAILFGELPAGNPRVDLRFARD